MCDLTTIDYQKGDVVWVKLGSLWWPGLVHDYDSLPEDIKADTQAFKKQPIAYVKFFQEDNFEYVKDIHSIYHYNCLKKTEFIKKGLDMMRSTRISTSNMQLFPGDIITAENLTNGDPKILDRPEFSSEEEGGKAVYEDLFSSPNAKRLKKKKDGKDPALPAIGFLKMDPRRKSVPSKLARNAPKPISQDRLLNLSEDAAAKGYKSKELIQDPATNGAVEKNFSCVECNYQCSRVNVMLLHYKCHSRHFDHKIKYPASFKRKKRNNNASSGGVSKKIKLTNGGEVKKVKSKAELLEQQKLEAEKLKQNFLMDWEEEENEEVEDEEKGVSKEEEKTSCFDFDEDEEEKANVSFARKRAVSKSEETELADQVDALLSETKLPTLPDIPTSKDVDAITLPPPVETESGFGTLNSDLNESLDFRNEIVSKVSSTPAPGSNKLSKQTLKTNYFKKVREEIAEVAKFEEDEEDGKQEDDFEDEEMGDENDAEKPGKYEEHNALEKAEVNASKTENVTKAETAKVVEENKLQTPVSKTPQAEVNDNIKASPSKPETDIPSKPEPVVAKTTTPVYETNTVQDKTALDKTNPVPQEVTKPATNTNHQTADGEKTPTKPDLTKPFDKVKETPPKEVASPNVIQIGNQTIHLPTRRNSREAKASTPGESKKTEPPVRAEEDRLAEMMMVEEVDLGSTEPNFGKQQPTSTVHIDMSPNEKQRDIKPQRGQLKTMPTIIPIETMHSKYKPINIPSTSTKPINIPSSTTKTPMNIPATPTKHNIPATSAKQPLHIPSSKQSPAKSSDETIYILPNNQRIKTPVPAIKSPAKSQIMLSSPDGKILLSLPASTTTTSKSQPTVSKSTPFSKSTPSGRSFYMSSTTKPANAPVITMKSTQKKANLPVPGLRKIAANQDTKTLVVDAKNSSETRRLSTETRTIVVDPKKSKPPNPLQSKIRTIAHNNASLKSSTPANSSNSSQKSAGSSHQNSSNSSQKSAGSSHQKSANSQKSTSQGSILVNQSTLPSILQARRSTQPVKVQPPALVSTPKVIEEAELLSQISSIPGTDSSDAVVYLINNAQSQQILMPAPEANISDSQTIYIDPSIDASSADLSNIYLTIDDDGNIINIVQNTEAPEVAPPCSDILAKALADTQVLQAECAVAGVAGENYANNTYETSAVLNQAPIMSTSEAPTQVGNPSYFSSTAGGAPLIEIRGQDNVQGMASPEIGYAPSDIQT